MSFFALSSLSTDTHTKKKKKIRKMFELLFIFIKFGGLLNGSVSIPVS